MGNQIFVSYSHKDKKWLEKLQTMLKPLTREKIILWDDTKIKAGTVWREELKNAIDSASVAVLLVSPDFLASDFIAEHELPPLLDAAKTRGLVILWIAIRISMYKETKIEGYQAANDPSRPLSFFKLSEQEQELFQICKKIKEAVKILPSEMSHSMEDKMIKDQSVAHSLQSNDLHKHMFTTSRETILIVDDDFLMSRFLSNSLEADGYIVFTADNAIKALDILEKEKIDLVISDIVMPVISGYDLLSQIRQRKIATRFIIMTAFPSVPFAVACLKLGASDFLIKPVSTTGIMLSIRRCLQIDPTLDVLSDNPHRAIDSLLAKISDLLSDNTDLQNRNQILSTKLKELEERLKDDITE